jgi:hypothetical protein
MCILPRLEGGSASVWARRLSSRYAFSGKLEEVVAVMNVEQFAHTGIAKSWLVHLHSVPALLDDRQIVEPRTIDFQ